MKLIDIKFRNGLTSQYIIEDTDTAANPNTWDLQKGVRMRLCHLAGTSIIKLEEVISVDILSKKITLKSRQSEDTEPFGAPYGEDNV